MSLEVCIKKELEGFCLHIDFQEDSRRIGVLGESGAGKTMTLKVLAGIERPDSGRVSLDGRVLYDAAKKIDVRPQKRKVGYLFQNYALFPNMNVIQNISAGIRSRDKKETYRRAAEMVEKFHLEGLEKRLPSELSGGQQQRVALARIMAYEPDMILLDEPFSALDVYLRDRTQEELMSFMRDYAGTVILISHSRDEIYRFSDRLLIMDRGRIISHGNTGDIFKNPETKAAAVMTGCKNISAVTVMDDHTLVAEDWGITLRLSRAVPEGTAFVGYRAHEFEPVWGERVENCIRFSLASRADLPFERNYYVEPEKESRSRQARITWFVQRDMWPLLDRKGLPAFLKLREEHLLFLQ